MTITLAQIRRFLAVARAGKVLGAARDLNVTQSAVTVSIREFEEALGVTLFDRHRQGVELTAEGRRILAYVRQVETAVDDLVDAARTIRREVEGRLRIGTTFTGSGWLLVPRLVLFKRRFPKVDVEIHEGSRDEVQALTAEGQLDFAVLITSNMSPCPDLVVHPILRSPRRLWLSPVHPLARQDIVSLREIARHPYALLTMDETDVATMAYWDRHGLKPEVVFRTSAVEGVREWVATGYGVTILADAVFRDWSSEGRKLVRRNIVEPLPMMEVGVVYRHDRALNDVDCAFRELLEVAPAHARPD